MRLHDFLDYHARERPESEFAVEGTRRLTYRGALAETNRLANAMVGARAPEILNPGKIFPETS